MSDARHDIGTAAFQSAPSLTAIAMWFTNHDLNYWVGVAGLIFILMQAGYLAWKWRRDIRRESAHQLPVDDE